MEDKKLAKKVVDLMFDKDLFSQWLGVERIKDGQGSCVLKMTVRKEMLNGFGIVHGGVTFSFADSALAFASNTYGNVAVALDCTISFPNPAKEGDELTARAEELSLSNKIGVYLITITNQKNEKTGIFKGTVYRTKKKFFPEVL